MSFYRDLQLDTAVLKERIRSGAASRQQVYYGTVLTAKAVLTLLFGNPRAAVMQRTLEYALMQDDPQAANEIGSHIYYLADQGYVKCYLGDEVLSLVQDPPREALVRLTAKGIDLMEGTLDDEGVAFGDPMRQ